MNKLKKKTTKILTKKNVFDVVKKKHKMNFYRIKYLMFTQKKKTMRNRQKIKFLLSLQ